MDVRLWKMVVGQGHYLSLFGFMTQSSLWELSTNLFSFNVYRKKKLKVYACELEHLWNDNARKRKKKSGSNLKAFSKEILPIREQATPSPIWKLTMEEKRVKEINDKTLDVYRNEKEKLYLQCKQLLDADIKERKG